MDMMVLGRPDAAPGVRADAPAPLRATRRLTAPPAAELLGRLGFGSFADPDDPPLGLLPGARGGVDTWESPGEQHAGRTGLLQWRHNADWLYGHLAVDAAPGELARQVQRAYTDLCNGMRDTGFVHPLRLWNYVPRINADEDGLERYRHFNAGRQQAFLAAGQSAFEGAPAACALGTHGGPVCIRVLAGRHRPVPIENPRQVSAYHYPGSYGPRTPSFSRAALVDAGGGQALLLISGTASIVGHATLHAGNLDAQLSETLTNLQAVIDAAHQHGSARFTLRDLVPTVYVRHAEHAPRVRQLLAQALGADAPATASAVLLNADICRHDLLVEIEAHGHAPGEVRA
jgi:chorismate lyase/3-hydroxybenzoate synthase